MKCLKLTVFQKYSIKQSKRIKIENNSITGSMNLKGGLIDDISFKKHKKSQTK